MDKSLGLTSATSGLTKDDFINQAHEARQARELTRRRERAATIIQSSMKAYHVRQGLKEETFRKFDKIIKSSLIPVDEDLLLLLRRLLFHCDMKKDRRILDSLLQYIIRSSSLIDECDSAVNSNVKNVSETTQSLIDEAIKESIELSRDHESAERDVTIKLNNQRGTNSQDHKGFLESLVEDCLKSENNFKLWVHLIEKVLNLCFSYLEDANSAHLDSQHIDTYLQVINLFTTTKYLSTIPQLTGDQRLAQNKNYLTLVGRISDEVLSRTLFKWQNFFACITELICEKINRFRNDLKTTILSNYTQIALKLLRLDNQASPNQKPVNPALFKEKCAKVLALMLCIPGFIFCLEKHSPNSLTDLIENSVFKLSITVLVGSRCLQELTSTSSVCLLANLIHLASLNIEELIADTPTFVILATKLLDICQKNMLQSSSLNSSNIGPNTKNFISKMSDSGDVSFNPLLGWLVRERAMNIDKEVISSQLSHLWSDKFLRILLSDLIKTNEKISVVNQNSKAQSSSPKHRSLFSYKSSPQNQSNPDHDPQPASLFRRAVERATSTVSRTINTSYSKTSGVSSNSGASKLTTPEANRISSVCLMLYKALKTLTVRQDILTGLCLHDYILTNLWTYISSLGPQDGLKAFLEHLTIYTKTNAPEFHILILFCKCASHLISILDDSELYEKQQPFRIEDLIAISAFLNNFVFRIICNNLVPENYIEMDPILETTHKLLTDLYKRDCRRKFTPHDHWLIKEIKMSTFLKDLEAGKPMADTIMRMLPHIIPHKERVLIFRRIVSRDKQHFCTGPSTLITIHRSRIVEDGYNQFIRASPNALKGLIRVKFINDYGLDEAGIDQDGVFKEFLEDTIKKVFDPALNLFCSTSEQRLYPSPTSRLHEDHLALFNFVGRLIGKAVYEGIVVDIPFASFFLSRVLGQPQSQLYSPIDELPSLDPELYKSLTYIKHYEGDVSELDLTFSIDQDFMGKIETHELEPGGRSIAVTRESRVRYIHSVANFRMRTQIEKQTEAFVSGFRSIINLECLNMFSASEFQRLISGDNTPIDLQDLRRHTKYFGGFHNSHRVICWLWDTLEKDFSTDEHKLFLKFVTSCSKPPLLGFANLEPPFSIRCVEVGDDQDLGDTVGSVLRGFFAIRRSDLVDRLPTSSTCFNLLKLPNYQRRSTLREKLRYAIQCNPGFELS